MISDTKCLLNPVVLFGKQGHLHISGFMLTHALYFNGHFLGKPGLAVPLDLILHIYQISICKGDSLIGT